MILRFGSIAIALPAAKHRKRFGALSLPRSSRRSFASLLISVQSRPDFPLRAPSPAASSGGGNADDGGGALVNLGFLVCVTVCRERETGNEGDCGESRDGEWDGVEGGAMCVRWCFHRVHGLCSWVFELHCFLVLIQFPIVDFFLFLLARYRIISGFSFIMQLICDWGLHSSLVLD